MRQGQIFKSEVTGAYYLSQGSGYGYWNDWEGRWVLSRNSLNLLMLSGLKLRLVGNNFKLK